MAKCGNVMLKVTFEVLKYVSRYVPRSILFKEGGYF